MWTQQICKRCVMDTTNPNIIFDEKGYCNHCNNALVRLSLPIYGLAPEKKKEELDRLVAKIKKDGKGKRYDCIIGLSGGVDSTYTAYLVKQWGLRPIAIHADNHWNSGIAEDNIRNLCDALKIPLERKVVDWEEFKDMQLAFLRASTPDSEIPTDNLIIAILFEVSKKYKIKYIMTGFNQAGESIMSKEWSQGHFDTIYIKTLHKRYGKLKKVSFPMISQWDIIISHNLRGVRTILTLDYIEYDKERAKSIIKDKLGWKDYGRKHGESIYTRVLQEYILPTKFGFDKRKAHYSSLIVAGQMSRDEALKMLAQPLYTSEQDIHKDINLVCNKFDITKQEFDEIIKTTPKKYSDYPNIEKTLFPKTLAFLSKIRRLGKRKN